MMSLHHPNCVRCYEVLETPKHVILALEMAENDLFSLNHVAKVQDFLLWEEAGPDELREIRATRLHRGGSKG